MLYWGGNRMKRKVLSSILVMVLLISSVNFAFAATYNVKSGDVLWKIAEKYNSTWQELAKANTLANPHLIFPNQVLTIPEKGELTSPMPIPPAATAVVDAEFTKYFTAMDTDYAYNLGVELAENPLYESSSLGTRTAGSDAEHATATFLASEMKKIGLSDVEKVGVKVDKWQFNDATLTIDGTDKVIKPHSYATAATPAKGINAEIVYLGKGTMWDYTEDINVKGKIVLVDIDQRADWWITYPMMEAKYQGAAAIMAANISGFAEIDKSALNSQDICGPIGIPTVSISQNDSDYIKQQLKAGIVTANLKVDNIVEKNGTSYNVMGKIPGKNHDEMIVIGSHYDKYFDGFQDNGMAVALDFAMAKAIIDSGYIPERDIVFVIHGAEEWGASDTPFDWTVGAWRMINEAHPEWVGKTLAFKNFELPAYEFAKYTGATSAPEFYTMIKDFVKNDKNAPKPVNCFPEGFNTDGAQTYTYSDDFSYYAAGVPSVINTFLVQADGDVFPFYYERYHSQFDNKATYNEDVFRFNLSFYGALALTIDQTPALNIDFTPQYERMMASFNEEQAMTTVADTAAFKAALEAYGLSAKANHNAVVAINKDYANLVKAGASDAELQVVWDKAKKMNASNLAIFKQTQDAFLGLMYERPIVPHEAPQENIQIMNTIITELKAGNINVVVDEYAWALNNVLEWYNNSFSPEVTKHLTDYYYPEYNKGNLFWGTGKMFIMADVSEATRSLYLKYDTTGSDFSDEIAVYQKAIASQNVIYKDLISKETISLVELKKSMDAVK